MLAFHQLTINACDKPLLHSVSGHLKAGDKVALIGRSGSGKSVLLQALADLLPLDDGAIYFDGTALTDIAPVIYRGTVAFIAQKPALVQGTGWIICDCLLVFCIIKGVCLMKTGTRTNWHSLANRQHF